MEIIRRLYNPYNKIFQVEFKDGVVINGKYDFDVIYDSRITVYLEVCPDKYETENDLNHVWSAKTEIKKYIYEKMKESIQKNF